MKHTPGTMRKGAPMSATNPIAVCQCPRCPLCGKLVHTGDSFTTLDPDAPIGSELSVRARNVLDSMESKVWTLRDLAAVPRAVLEQKRHIGKTSLRQIENALARAGLRWG